MYRIKLAATARRSLKKRLRSGSFNQVEYIRVVNLLRDGKPLDQKHKDHALQGGLSRYRECHLAFNLLLQYEVDDRKKMVTIAKIGTHDELFG